MDKRYDTIEETESKPARKSFGIVEKFNPYHGYHGYFSSANAAGAYAPLHGKTENGQRLLDHYKETHGGKVGGGGGKISQQDLDDAAADSVADFMERQSSSGANSKPSSHKMAEGKDLVETMDSKEVGKMHIEEVLAAQGFDGKPKVVSADEFAKAVEDNGNIACRGIRADDQMTLDAYDDQLKNGDFYVKCDGGNAMGRGMYMATSWNGTNDYKNAQWVANDYATAPDQVGKVLNMTLDKSAKIITKSKLFDMAREDAQKLGSKNSWGPDTWADMDTAKEDIGAYAAAKGFDAIKEDWGNYTVVLNRTKLVILDGMDGDLRESTEGKNILDAGLVPFF